MSRSLSGRAGLAGFLLAVCGSAFSSSSVAETGWRSWLGLSRPACSLGSVPPDHLLLTAFAISSETVTNLQFRGGGAARLLTVEIEPGPVPITLAAVADGEILFEFKGAIDRVRRLTVVPLAGGAGVIGLPGGRVSFADRDDCLETFRSLRTSNALEARLPTIFGRAPDKIARFDTASAISLPSGRETRTSSGPGQPTVIVEQPGGGTVRSTMEPDGRGGFTLRRTFDPRSWSELELADDAPGGVRVLDAQDVIASRPLLTPNLQPGVAGMVQLERSGSLRSPRPGEVPAWAEVASRPYRSALSPDFRFRVVVDHVVTGDVALPADVGGKTYLVPAGVPRPRNVPRGSCLLLPGGAFEPPDPGTCFRNDDAGAMRILTTLPTVPDGACRLLTSAEQPSGADALSVYGARKPGTQNGASYRAGGRPLEVVVRRQAPVLLVLNSYESSLWQVKIEPGARVAGVLLTGYHASSVEGLEPGTPVEDVSYDSQAVTKATAPGCLPFVGSYVAFHGGGPAANVLDRQVRALTGMGVRSLQGAQLGDRFEID